MEGFGLWRWEDIGGEECGVFHGGVEGCAFHDDGIDAADFLRQLRHIIFAKEAICPEISGVQDAFVIGLYEKHITIYSGMITFYRSNCNIADSERNIGFK